LQEISSDRYNLNPQSKRFIAIQDQFSNSVMRWPFNFGDYSEAWQELEGRKGRFAIVAFNDKGADEVFFVTGSHWEDEGGPM